MNRVHFGLIIGLIVALAFTAGLAGRVPTVVRAEKFVLVDRDGRDRAVLEVTDIGPTLRLIDGNGTDRVALSAAEGGSGLVLKDRSGNDRVFLIAPNEASSLVMWDENGNEQLGLRADATRSALTLGDIQGVAMDGAFASLVTRAEGPFLFLRNRDGMRRITVEEIE